MPKTLTIQATVLGQVVVIGTRQSPTFLLVRDSSILSAHTTTLDTATALKIALDAWQGAGSGPEISPAEETEPTSTESATAPTEEPADG